MGGESWCITKAPFPDLKVGHVDHLISYIYLRIIYWTIFSRNFYDNVVNYIFLS